MNRITKYVLTVHKPTSRSIDEGRMSGGVFLTSSTPFVVPRIGDEISIEMDGNEKLGWVVTSRVTHRIKATADAVVCEVSVYTRCLDSPEADG
jgi:hypothetical protein